MNEERLLTPEPFAVERLLKLDGLDLSVTAAKSGLKRTIKRAELNRPALELSGFFEKWQPERVQILGSGEMTYIERYLQQGSFRENLNRIFASKPPCVVITNGLPAFDFLIQLAEEHQVTLFGSNHNTTHFSKALWGHLEMALSPYVVRRGVLMDIFDVGVIIGGPSSIGKSETALELLAKGHTFVADDLVLVRKTNYSELIGTGRSPIPYHMEVRGIGIIDISRMYGPRSYRISKHIDMMVNLEDWDVAKDYERLGIESRVASILEVKFPCYTIPVKPGRNIASILEIAVLDHKLKQSGVFMAKEFDEKLIQSMRKQEGR